MADVSSCVPVADDMYMYTYMYQDKNIPTQNIILRAHLGEGSQTDCRGSTSTDTPPKHPVNTESTFSAVTPIQKEKKVPKRQISSYAH